MLTELLQSQCKQLLDQHLQFYNDKQLLADKVISEEVRNLHSLLLLLVDGLTCLLWDSVGIGRLCWDVLAFDI